MLPEHSCSEAGSRLESEPRSVFEISLSWPRLQLLSIHEDYE